MASMHKLLHIRRPKMVSIATKKWGHLIVKVILYLGQDGKCGQSQDHVGGYSRFFLH